MPKVSLRITAGPATLRTVGSVWTFPRGAGDHPVNDLVTVRRGSSPTELELGYGSYVYYLVAGGHNAGQYTIRASAEDGTTTTKTLSTKPAGTRSFIFRV